MELPTMRVEVEDHGRVSVITILEPRLDASRATEFREIARDAVRDGIDFYIMDLSRVMFIDSSGVGSLVGMLKLVGRERRLELCGMTAPVLKVFKLTRLDSVFPIMESVNSSLEAHRKEGRMTG
jgi:anti-sigma B factor antagonist